MIFLSSGESISISLIGISPKLGEVRLLRKHPVTIFLLVNQCHHHNHHSTVTLFNFSDNPILADITNMGTLSAAGELRTCQAIL